MPNGIGVRNKVDAFPDDPDESADSDGDGIGDNEDVFPNDPEESVDSDDDGVGDNADNCPDITNPNQEDSDGVGDVCAVVEPYRTLCLDIDPEDNSYLLVENPPNFTGRVTRIFSLSSDFVAKINNDISGNKYEANLWLTTPSSTSLILKVQFILNRGEDDVVVSGEYYEQYNLLLNGIDLDTSSGWDCNIKVYFPR